MMKFYKMQGTGNDFIVLNNMELHIPLEKFPAMAKHLCRRGFSIGANALMVIDSPARGGDFQMRFYNADGSIAEMCGNGARCIARYAYELKLAGERMVIETIAGDVAAWRLDRRLYKIKLNNPEVIELSYDLTVDGKTYECAYIELGSPGIPHAIVKYDGLSETHDADIREPGSRIRHHEKFPKGTNVNFYEVLDSANIIGKTFERGVEDFTLACGTGSGATALALTLKGEVSAKRVKASVPGGELFVEIDRESERIKNLYLIGDTNIVATGEITDEDLAL